jgi:hypothetical protein
MLYSICTLPETLKVDQSAVFMPAILCEMLGTMFMARGRAYPCWTYSTREFTRRPHQTTLIFVVESSASHPIHLSNNQALPAVLGAEVKSSGLTPTRTAKLSQTFKLHTWTAMISFRHPNLPYPDVTCF